MEDAGRVSAAIQAYSRLHGGEIEQERRWYANRASLEDAVRSAAFAETPSGSRHGNQQGIPRKRLDEAAAILAGALDRIRECDSFGELQWVVERLIGGVRGLGPVMIYDTARRVGAYLDLEPDRVYLVRSRAREGAARLGLGDRRVIHRSELPAPLRRLRPADAEHFLFVLDELPVSVADSGDEPALPDASD